MTNSTLNSALKSATATDDARRRADQKLNPDQQASERSGQSSNQPAGQDNSPSLPITNFIWGAGIECSFLPHMNIDQFEWTQHNRYWKEDFRLARNDLGITHLRYAFPWHVLESKRGTFDWSYSDQRVEEAEKLGLNLILDVMHFGTPLWLKQ